MEKLTLKRVDCTDEYTFGELWYNDRFLCHTLEDPIRDRKVKHKTAIPYGTYKIVITMSQRFKQLMPRLLNVPNFTGILIHKGNTVENTSGCILVGESRYGNKLLYSVPAYTEVFLLIKKILKTNDLEIEIVKDVPKEIIQPLTNLSWKNSSPNSLGQTLNLSSPQLSAKSKTLRLEFWLTLFWTKLLKPVLFLLMKQLTTRLNSKRFG